MVQALDDSINRPNYNAVKINIKNPAVNKGQTEGIADDNGIYQPLFLKVSMLLTRQQMLYCRKLKMK